MLDSNLTSIDDDKSLSKDKHNYANSETLAYLNEEQAKRLVEFLKYSGLNDAYYDYNEDNNYYEVLISSKEFEKAKDLYDVFSVNELNEKEETAPLTEESSTVLYENTNEKYNDYKSSSITFFICGIAGLVVIILNNLKVINLFSNSGASFILINVVLIALFIGFIVIGFISLRSSKKLKSLANEESQAKATIFKWLDSNVTIEEINEACEDGIPEEMKYFERHAFLKNKLNTEFKDISKETVDLIIDNYIESKFN